MKKSISITIALIFLAQSVSAGMMTDITSMQNDWKAVAALPAGENLEVELKTGKKVRGRLEGVTDREISILEKGRISEVKQDDVSRIYRLEKQRRGKSTLRGAAIGGAFGVGGGLLLYLPNRDDIVGWVVPAFGAIGAGIGAGVGAVFGGGSRRVLIYQA